MAVTSEWSWLAINRQSDLNISNGVYFNRPNWTLMRYRISNDTYTSELDDTATSLSGYNGGVTETISVPTPTTRSVTFGSAKTWTLTSTNWVETGYTINQSKVYTPYYSVANIPDSALRNAVFLWGPSSASAYYWVVSEFSAIDVASGNLLRFEGNLASPAASYVNYASSAGVSKGSSIDSVSFATAAGTFNASSTASTTTFTPGTFTCTADDQVYNQPFVDWYTQTQTWIYKAPWFV